MPNGGISVLTFGFRQLLLPACCCYGYARCLGTGSVLSNPSAHLPRRRAHGQNPLGSVSGLGTTAVPLTPVAWQDTSCLPHPLEWFFMAGLGRYYP